MERDSIYQPVQSTTKISVKTIATTNVSSFSDIKCQFCKASHRASDCSTYPTVQTRLPRARTLKLCLNCLKTKHFIKDCKSTYRCRTCKGKHHTALCRSSNNPMTLAPTNSQPSHSAISQASGTTKPNVKHGTKAIQSSATFSALTSRMDENATMTASAIPTATVTTANQGVISFIRTFFILVHRDLLYQVNYLIDFIWYLLVQ